MTKPLDLTGQRFGLLTALHRAPFNNAQGGAMWVCACDCGGEKTAWAQNLKGGLTSSCGCIRKKQLAERNRATKRTHGMSKSAEHRIWSGILDRATNPNSKDFSNYQARGITVCERWRSFENFLADMGPRPSRKHSIDRIDNDGNYSPENCRWALPHVQHANRRVSINVTHDGERLPLAEWARRVGIDYRTLYSRYKKGISGHALFAPISPLNCRNTRSRHRA